MIKIIEGGKGIVVGFEKFNLDDYPDLSVVGCNATSTEHLPHAECEQRGIKVISLKGETEFLKDIPSVAELTIWFMLELLRKPHEGRFLGNQLKEKKICLVGGNGRIATHVRERLMGFETLIHSVDKGEWAYFGTYDIISLHVPLNKETEGMVNKKYFELMKPGAIFINTSRPQIVNKEDLIWAIKERSIRYGMDFYDKDLDGLALMTDHIGGNTVEAIEQTEEFIAKKVAQYLKK